MNQSTLQEPLDSPAPSDVYDRAFVRTVLRLYGIGAPTPAQLEKARKILRLHAARSAMAGLRQSSAGDAPAGKRLSQPAAVEHAFLFVRYQSISTPTATQIREFNDWLVQADLYGRRPSVSNEGMDSESFDRALPEAENETSVP
jgi:hypothetical protein